MKRVGFLSVILPMLTAISIFCAHAGETTNAGVAETEIFSGAECFFAERPAAGWEKLIPQNAKKIKYSFGQTINLDQVAGRTGKCMDECVFYVSFLSSGDTTLNFGLGADWWVDVFLNGERCFSTMKDGNRYGEYAVWNHPLLLPVKAGKNLLAIKVRRGDSSWNFVCGPMKSFLWKKGPGPQSAVHSGKSYRLIVLGDLHFDTDEKVYHSDFTQPNARLNKIYRQEFARNADMWKKRSPRMMTAAASHITPDTLAVIQVGDLIQGDCGNPEVHSKMLIDTLFFLKKEFKGLPFLTVAGNHDVRGKDAKKAYHRTMPEYLSGELKQTIQKTTFYTMLGGDLFLFIDFNDPDTDVVMEAMKQKARYKFVVCHAPVLPSASNLFYEYLYAANNQRRTSHQFFMGNDVIVLTGHMHALELTECVTTYGRITQLMANSVWASDDLAKFQTVFSEPSDYGKGITNPEAKVLFAEYKEVITRYWKAKGAGYFVLDISPDGVVAKYYGGDSRTPSKEIRLR